MWQRRCLDLERKLVITSYEEVKKHDRTEAPLTAELDKYTGHFKELYMPCGVVLFRNERSGKST